MNQLNHFLFSLSLLLFFLDLTPVNFFLSIISSYFINKLLDLDHKILKNKPWYFKRTWIQEPSGFLLIGLPLAFLLSFLNSNLFLFIVIPYFSHIFLDYLCIYETQPFAPFFKFKKQEGLGIFIPDNLFKKSENSLKWKKRVKERNLKGISENYFSIINIVILLSILLYRINT